MDGDKPQADEIPKSADAQTVAALRDTYRREHLLAIAPDAANGKHRRATGLNWSVAQAQLRPAANPAAGGLAREWRSPELPRAHTSEEREILAKCIVANLDRQAFRRLHLVIQTGIDKCLPHSGKQCSFDCIPGRKVETDGVRAVPDQEGLVKQRRAQ